MKPGVESHEVLMDELAKLSNQQHEALERAIFLNLSGKEAQEFDQRATRIEQIREFLGVQDSRYGAA